MPAPQAPAQEGALSQPMNQSIVLNAEGKDFLSVEDVARSLGVATVSVYRLVERRALPVYRVLRKLLFRRSEVNAWLEAKRTAPRDPSVCL